MTSDIVWALGKLFFQKKKKILSVVTITKGPKWCLMSFGPQVSSWCDPLPQWPQTTQGHNNATRGWHDMTKTTLFSVLLLPCHFVFCVGGGLFYLYFLLPSLCISTWQIIVKSCVSEWGRPRTFWLVNQQLNLNLLQTLQKKKNNKMYFVKDWVVLVYLAFLALFYFIHSS